MTYTPPPGYRVGLEFAQAYTIPPGYRVGLEFVPGERPIGDTQYLFAQGWQSSQIGAAALRLQYLRISPAGWMASLYGKPAIYNLRQIRAVQGFSTALYGKPYVQGGVKFIAPAGWASLAMGAVKVVNTTADQYIRPAGMGAIALPIPSVSPRFLRPGGIYGLAMGYAQVQFPPQPKGWLSTAFGYPNVYFKTKHINPSGIDSMGIGFPAVRDRAQTILHRASPITSIFGDVYIRALNQHIQALGLDALELGSWAEVRSTRRALLVSGEDQARYGAVTIGNVSPSVAPQGIAPNPITGHGIGYRHRLVAPAGLPPPWPQLGTATLTKTPSIGPQGIWAPGITAPTVWPRQRVFNIQGWNSERWGSHMVAFRWRGIGLDGAGISTEQSSGHWLSHALRTLLPNSTFGSFMALGQPKLSHRQQAITLQEGISAPNFGAAYVGRHQYIGAEGFEATRWGTRIIPAAQELLAEPFAAQQFGQPGLQNHTQFVSPEGVTTYPEPGMHWGLAKAWNLRQYIVQEHNPEDGLNPPFWPIWTKIGNRNRSVGAIGFAATRFGYQGLANNARLIGPSGIAAPADPEWPKRGSVTHRLRPLPLQGIEPPLLSTWGVVRNAARVIAPAGVAHTEFGTADVLNNRRYPKMNGFETAEFGMPFVAYAVRWLTVESRYGIHPPVIALPTVELLRKYVEVPTVSEGRMGQQHILDTRFNRVQPRWGQQSDLFGRVSLKNKTPEYHLRGWDSSEFGQAEVRLQWRPIYPQGSSMQLFGQAIVADRTLRVQVSGLGPRGVGNHKIVRLGSDPPSLQRIDLRKFVYDPDSPNPNELDEGYGIAPPNPQVSNPNLLKGYVFAESIQGLRMGTPQVLANSIRVEPGYSSALLVGVPWVSLKRRGITVPTLGQQVRDRTSYDDGNSSWGVPGMSPHRIYAVLEAPDIARKNHPGQNKKLHAVNEGIVMGSPRVRGTRDVISPVGFGPIFTNTGFTGAMGTPGLHNRRQQIHVNGFNALRVGWPVIPGTQTVVVEDPADAMVFGRPSLSRPPPPPFANPAGIAAPPTGTAFVSHFHRAVRPTGLHSLAMGSSRPDPTLRMPQSLYVGAPILNHIQGFDAAQYGEAWISHRVREVAVEGFDGFVSEYDLEKFNLRMRVRRVDPPPPARQMLGPEGFSTASAGTPNVRPGAHYIRPDGNTMHFRQGGHDAN